MFLHTPPLLDSGPLQDKALDHRSPSFSVSTIHIVGTKRIIFNAFIKLKIELSYLSSHLRCYSPVVNYYTDICFF